MPTLQIRDSLLPASLLLLVALIPGIGHAQAGAATATAESAATATTATTTPPGAVPSTPAKHKRLIPEFGPNASYYYFTDSKTRSRFGSSVQGIGLGLGGIRPTVKGKLGVDFSMLYGNETQNGQKNRYFVVGAGPEFRRGIVRGSGAKEPRNLPYLGCSVTAMYGRIKSPRDNIDGSGLGVGASVLGGVAFGTRGYAEARFRLASPTKGFSFSGAGVAVGLRF